MPFLLKSSALADGQEIPRQYTGEGKDISPPLEWSGVPINTQEFALICEDPDAPRPEPWVHWLIYQIPHGVTTLPEGIPQKQKLEHPVSALQGINSFDKIGYNGPMPPPGHGWHRYFFKLFALDVSLKLHPAAKKEELLKAMEGHIVGKTQIFGRFKRESQARKVS